MCNVPVPVYSVYAFTLYMSYNTSILYYVYMYMYVYMYIYLSIICMYVY